MTAHDKTLQIVTTSARRGAEVFAIELDRALCALGRDVETVALAPGDQGDTSLGVPVLGARRLAPSTLRALRARVVESDVVVAHGSSTLPASAVATLGTRVPFVYRNVGDPSYWGTTAVRRARVRTLLRRAQLVVALTDDTAEALEARYAVPREKLRVIPKGVPAERYPFVDRERRSAARHALGIEDDGRLVAYVGALSPEKAPNLAIEAIARIPDVQLVIAGDGPERGDAERLANEIAPGRVHFLGAVNDPASVYASADSLVVPSRTEGLPGVLMEAGLSGLPSVTTDVGFVRAIVRDGETGFVVASREPGAVADAIDAALQAPPSMGQAARSYCLAHFDIARIAERWHALLSEVTGGSAQ